MDLTAIADNVRSLRQIVAADGTSPLMMSVVKANAYGHGLRETADAARAGGADWLGVATLAEAVAVRRAGDTGPLLCWLAAPGADYAQVIAAGVDVTASSVEQLEEIAHGAALTRTRARTQLKLDTGLSRNGASRDHWLELFTTARSLQDQGRIEVTGVFSHLACADDPDHPANEHQEIVFLEAVSLAKDAGLDPELIHLANSAAAVLRPSSRFDMVRCGIATYGLSPAPAIRTPAQLGLTPAMTVSSVVVNAKDLGAGEAISYGLTYTVTEPTHVALVPMGYAEGIPRAASNRGEVLIDGVRAPIRGTVCMDQFVVEAPDARVGDRVIVFGPGTQGEPTAQDWAEWCGTINYEIVTRIGGRATRTFKEGPREVL